MPRRRTPEEEKAAKAELRRRLKAEDRAIKKQCAALVPSSMTEACKKAIDDIKRGAHGNPHNRITLRTIEAILTSVAKGEPGETAAENAGITAKTLYEWKRRYEGFSDALARAAALCNRELIRSVFNSRHERPELALKMLERKDPANWAEKRDLRVSGSVEHPVINVANMQQIAAMRRQMDIQEAEVISMESEAPNDDGSTALPRETGSSRKEDDELQQ